MIEVEVINAARDEVVNNLLDKARELQALSFIGRTVTINFCELPEFQIRPVKEGGKTYYRSGLESLEKYEEIISDKRGAIYYFHLPNGVTKDDITGALNKCKTSRAIPSIHNLDKRNKYQVLYVGSMKSDFFTRFYQHLGYGTPKTAALNLLHWAPELFSDIEMTYYPIPHSRLALHTLMEVALCNTVVPMIGRMEKDIIKG